MTTAQPTYFTSQDLNQRTSAVIAAAERDGEVIITKRGVPRLRIVGIRPHASEQRTGLDLVRDMWFPELDGIDDAFFDRAQDPARDIDL